MSLDIEVLSSPLLSALRLPAGKHTLTQNTAAAVTTFLSSNLSTNFTLMLHQGESRIYMLVICIIVIQTERLSALQKHNISQFAQLRVGHPALSFESDQAKHLSNLHPSQEHLCSYHRGSHISCSSGRRSAAGRTVLVFCKTSLWSPGMPSRSYPCRSAACPLGLNTGSLVGEKDGESDKKRFN